VKDLPNVRGLAGVDSERRPEQKWQRRRRIILSSKSSTQQDVRGSMSCVDVAVKGDRRQLIEFAALRKRDEVAGDKTKHGTYALQRCAVKVENALHKSRRTSRNVKDAKGKAKAWERGEEEVKEKKGKRVVRTGRQAGRQ